MERFSLTLMPDKFSIYGQVDWHLPTFDSFLRPVLDNSKYCYVYGISETNITPNLSTILIKYKGKYRLDLTKEVISGYEFLWNGSYPERGSIVIVLEPDNIDFSLIFSHCFETLTFNNPNTGMTPGAVKFSKKQVEQGFVSLCFSETNGFEWVDVFAPKELGLCDIALLNCDTKTNMSEWEKFKKPKRKLPGSIGW